MLYFPSEMLSKYVLSVYHQADACLCAKHVHILQTELLSKMKLLKETVRAKTAIHTAQVFVSVLVTAIMSCYVIS